jgi:hypothetical protein
VNGNNTVNDVKTRLTKVLNIQDNDSDDDHQQISSSFIPSNSNNSSSSLPLNGVENQNMPEENKKEEKEELLHSDKCPTKSVYHGNVNEIEDDNDTVMAELITDFEYVKPFNPALLVPSKKLVSSMKGGREKPLEKKSVTWAPDVYDPVPTSVSHLLTNKSQRHHHHRSSSSSSSKKHSKSSSKHKGSSSKTSSRSSGKDKKKQSHRASSSRSYKEERVHGADFYNSNSALDFDVANSPESYCGTSFLKETLVSKLHFSVAEAT